MSNIQKRPSSALTIPIRPEILRDPNTPKPLHGMNLRHILGEEWWDEVRHKAYKKANFRCTACGTPKAHTKERYLVAHQRYDYDYASGRAELLEIVALCADCKAFIHSGLQVYHVREGKITVAEFERIYTRGFDLLRKAGLVPWWGTMLTWLQYRGHATEDAMKLLAEKGYYKLSSDHCDWGDWHLVIPGDLPGETPRIQHTMYESLEEWYWSYNPDGDMVFRQIEHRPSSHATIKNPLLETLLKHYCDEPRDTYDRGDWGDFET